MNVTEMREKQLNIRLSDEEARRVEYLSDHHGVNAAALFRMLLKKEERALLVEGYRYMGPGERDAAKPQEPAPLKDVDRFAEKLGAKLPKKR